MPCRVQSSTSAVVSRIFSSISAKASRRPAPRYSAAAQMTPPAFAITSGTQHTALSQLGLGVAGYWDVGSFQDNPGRDLPGIGRGHHIGLRRGNKDLAIHAQDVVSRHRRAAVKAGDRPPGLCAIIAATSSPSGFHTVMAELNGELAALINDLDRGLFDREQATRILALTVDNARHEIMAILSPGAPGEISYRAG